MELKEQLKQNLVSSITAIGNCAVLFSGGVDSTLIAAILKSSGKKFTCYTAGFPGSDDMEQASHVALEMAFDHVLCEIDDIEQAVRLAIKTTGLRDPVNVGISIPLLTACSQVREKVQKEDLARDRAIASNSGLELRTPYLDIDVIRIAMQLPESMKISEAQNKIVLREIAGELGVPEDVCGSRKRAAQYGSGAMKKLKKLAKSRRFKTTTDYLNSI
jgi:asparagine synthase (glutamine-hydrolysing)